MMKKIIIYTIIALFVCAGVSTADDVTMEIGTNFWARVDWTGEITFKQGVDFKDAWNSGITDYLVNEDIWNPEFLAEIDFYTVLRFMDWVPTNKSSVVNWTQRKLPINPDQTAPFKDQPGIAIEWMVDLCNRVDADMWFCLPHAANDEYIENLATLIYNQLNPQLKIYIEYSNEVWNFSVQKNYATSQGSAIGIKTQEYVAHRSTEIWQIFKNVFGDSFESRVVKTICGQSTNSWIAREQLAYLYSDKNPSGLHPDVYGTAPYFDGKGFDDNISNAFDIFETDIFEHRWDKPNKSSRIDNVETHYNLLKSYDENLKLVSYEGGQHITENATKVNYDPRMYDLYLRYLEALDEYVTVFAHYVNCGSCGDGGCWGAKKYTGQPAEEAPKYKALVDYANGIRADVRESHEPHMPTDFQLGAYPNPFNGATTIEVTLAQDDEINLSIYDIRGRLVNQIMQQKLNAGTHRVQWHAQSASGLMPSGVYIARVHNGIQHAVTKLVFVK